MYKYYFQIIRFYNLLLGGLAVCLMAYVLNNQNYSLIFICALDVMCIMAFGNLMNDYLDKNADQINHPSRILPQNLITLKSLKIFCIILMMLILILTLKLNFSSQILVYFIVLPFMVSYNFFLQKTPLIGNIIIAFLLGLIFVFSELVLSNKIVISIIPFLLAFNLSLIREVIKDLHDYKGDLYDGQNTLPIVLGINKTCQLLVLYIITCIVLFVLPYFYGFYGNIYLILLIFCIEIPLIYSVFLLLKFQTQKTFKHLSLLYKILSAIGLLIILLTIG